MWDNQASARFRLVQVYKALIERGLCNDQYQLRLRSTQQVVHLQCSAREVGRRVAALLASRLQRCLTNLQLNCRRVCAVGTTWSLSVPPSQILVSRSPRWACLQDERLHWMCGQRMHTYAAPQTLAHNKLPLCAEPAASVRCNGCWQSWSLPYSEKPFYSHDWLCRTCSGVAGCSAQKNRLTDRYVLLDLGAGRAALGVVDYHSGGYADGEEAVPEACYGVKQYARQHGGRKRGRSELLMYTFGQLVGRDEHELGVTLLPERFRPMC